MQRRLLLRTLHGFIFTFLSLVAGGGRLAAQDRTLPLLLRTPVSVSFDAGHTPSLALVASCASQAEVLLDASTPGIQFAILSPGGKTIGTLTAHRPGWVATSFPCAEQGQYRLEARMSPSHDEMAGASVRADFLTFPSAHAQILAQAESLFTEAQSLAASPLQAPVRQAIEKFRQAGIAWAATGDREGQILALAGESQAWLDLSQGASSLLALDKARILSARMPFFYAWLENRRAQIYLDRMNSKQAATYAAEARHAGQDLNDPWLTAASLAELAESEYLVRAPTEHNDASAAIRLSRQVHAVLPLARALRCNAWIEQDAGRITRALSLLHQAEDLYQYGADSRDAAMGMSDMANNQELSGNPYTALLRHTALLPLIRRSGKLTYLEYLYGVIANDYQALNKVPDAIVFANRGLQIAHEVTLPSDELGDSIERSQLCDLQLSIGRLHQALDNCRKALDTVEQIRDPKRIAIASWRLGKVERALGRSGEAIASFRFAIDMSQSVGDVWTQPRALIDWGGTLENLGQDAQARPLFRKALRISLASEDPSTTIEARYRIARSEFRAGETPQARDDLQNLVISIEAQRRTVTDPELQASFFAQMHKCHELLIELLMRQEKRNPGSADEALDVSESGRARTLLDVLSGRENSAASPHLASTSNAWGDLHLAVDRSYDRRLRLMLEGASKSDLDANASALTQAIDALERQEDEQSTASPSSVAPEKIFRSQDFAAASQKLHSTLVEYQLGAERSFVWVIDNGNMQSYILPPRDRIESAVRRWRALATARIAHPAGGSRSRERIEEADKELPRVGADLSCMLLAPFLHPDTTHLVLVPDGQLNLLPFTALPENGCRGAGQPIAVKREVTLAPSLSVLLQSIQSSPPPPLRREVAILADPVFDRDDLRVHRTGPWADGDARSVLIPVLPRLFGAREEARTIAAEAGPGRSAVYLDFNANVRTLFDPSLHEYGILHLATHGIIDAARPEFSGIVLSLVNREGQPVFGYLNAHRIAESDLPFDLVVLSSCDSAAGPDLSGEGVVGLNHAFLSAGARRIVSTLWSVDDDATTKFMADFYDGMLRRGLDPSAALRRSQVRMMRNPATAAPYYWAGFAITSTVD